MRHITDLTLEECKQLLLLILPFPNNVYHIDFGNTFGSEVQLEFNYRPFQLTSNLHELEWHQGYFTIERNLDMKVVINREVYHLHNQVSAHQLLQEFLRK